MKWRKRRLQYEQQQGNIVNDANKVIPNVGNLTLIHYVKCLISPSWYIDSSGYKNMNGKNDMFTYF